jgi:hypothetical protein
MFRSRGENFRSVYILLFLNVAFFLLEHQDPAKFARMFRFDWNAVRGGEVWRLVTYQFTQAGTGFLEALALFVTLLLLSMMGSALEEEWGTRGFMTVFALSTLGSAGMAAFLGIPLLGTYFVYFTLVFLYASAFPQQTFYLFGRVPIPVRVLALFPLAILLMGVFSGGSANMAALCGAVLAYLYYLKQTVRVQVIVAPGPGTKIDSTLLHNAARQVALKQALVRGTPADVERLIAQCERDVVAGVNICPPADFKPDAMDGYCMRCEGFAECSARHLRAHRSAGMATADPAASSMPV